jgi:hypothetical protein
MVAVAIIGAAVVGGVSTVASSHSAAKTAAQTADKNNALQTDIYNQNKAALAPYQDGGKATMAINNLLGIGGDPTAQRAALKTYYDSTGYTSRLKQGQDSVTAALGSRGMLESGAAQKSLLKYGQTFASDEFGKYLGYLGGQQQVGLTAASAQAGVGQGYANAVTANNNNASNTASNAALATGGAINSTISSALSAYGLSQGMQSSYGKLPGSGIPQPNGFGPTSGLGMIG